MSNDIFADLTWRGLIHQTTDDDNIQEWLNEKPRTLYAGFDPTSSSLHVGNLMPLLSLRRFQKAGHRPIAIVGGATGMIGDPSGKSEERNMLSTDQLKKNVEGIQEQMASFLDFDCGDNSALLVNNFDWMQSVGYIQFLRDVGKHVSVNVMKTKDSVKSRLERDDAGMSYTEFSYMLLQAYDFVYLNREYGCELQIGGSDQWGNITLGVDLGRRMNGAQLHGVTCPLLTKSDGSKMGKTEKGALWLGADRTSPYAFFQYWMRVDDADVSNCLRFLTGLDQETVEQLDNARESEPHQRASQKKLAAELTRMVHGDEGLALAERATRIFFGEEIEGMDPDELVEIFPDVPSCQFSKDQFNEGIGLIDAFVGSGLAKSKGEARRTIEQGGGYVNNRRVEDFAYRFSEKDHNGHVIVIRSGRKKYAIASIGDK